MLIRPSIRPGPVQVAVVVGAHHVAEPVPAVRIREVRHHGRPAHAQLAARGAGDRAQLDLDLGHRPPAARRDRRVLAHDPQMVLAVEDRDRPRARPVAVELDQRLAERLDRAQQLVARERRAAVQQPLQPGAPPASTRRVTIPGTMNVVVTPCSAIAACAVSASKRSSRTCAEPEPQERERADDGRAVHDLLAGQEHVVVGRAAARSRRARRSPRWPAAALPSCRR